MIRALTVHLWSLYSDEHYEQNEYTRISLVSLDCLASTISIPLIDEIICRLPAYNVGIPVASTQMNGGCHRRFVNRVYEACDSRI